MVISGEGETIFIWFGKGVFGYRFKPVLISRESFWLYVFVKILLEMNIIFFPFE